MSTIHVIIGIDKPHESYVLSVVVLKFFSLSFSLPCLFPPHPPISFFFFCLLFFFFLFFFPPLPPFFFFFFCVLFFFFVSLSICSSLFLLIQAQSYLLFTTLSLSQLLQRHYHYDKSTFLLSARSHPRQLIICAT